MSKPRNRIQAAYVLVLQRLLKSRVPFLVGGAHAMHEYGQIVRETKDLDLFCRPRDSSAILGLLSELGYSLEVTDPEWLAKGRRKDILIDVIFGTGNRRHKVSDEWIERGRLTKVFDLEVRLLPPEEMILCKIYVQERDRYDGADINHIIRKSGAIIDWKHLLAAMDADWELLFAQILNFRFVYPSERNIIPAWMIQEMIARLDVQWKAPVPVDRICRGPIVAYTQYQIDTLQWGYRT